VYLSEGSEKVARQFGTERVGSTGSVALAGTVLAVATLLIVVFLAQVPAANPNVPSGSSVVSPSLVITGSSSTTVESVAQAPASQYPLVWAPNSPSVCSESEFCVVAELGFSANATQAVTQTTTTITLGNAITIEHGSTTTIIRNVTETVSCQPLDNATLATNQTSSVTSTSCTSSVTTYQDTAVGYRPDGSYPILVSALVQDAATGQNVVTSSGNSAIAFGCSIQPPAGYTVCYVMGHVPPGHTYKVTVSVTKLDGVTLLAPSQTITVTE